MENASRGPMRSKQFLNGLKNCIEKDAPISKGEKEIWTAIKDRGAALFAPEKGGSYAVFNARPLAPELMAYCANDVKLLPHLRAHYWAQLDPQSQARVVTETERRVRQSQTPAYRPDGPHKALGPWHYA